LSYEKKSSKISTIFLRSFESVSPTDRALLYNLTASAYRSQSVRFIDVPERILVVSVCQLYDRLRAVTAPDMPPPFDIVR